MATPIWESGLPYCDTACPSHDGKRCRETGFRPYRFCEPMLNEIVTSLVAIFAENLGPIGSGETLWRCALCRSKWVAAEIHADDCIARHLPPFDRRKREAV